MFPKGRPSDVTVYRVIVDNVQVAFATVIAGQSHSEAWRDANAFFDAYHQGDRS